MMEACCSRFTAAEGGARLAATAAVNNTLAVEYASFVATRLVHEDAFKIRGPLFEGYQRSVYVTRGSRVACVAYELRILTDLTVVQAVKHSDVYDWCAELDAKEVLVCTSEVLKQILEEDVLTMRNINVLILDSCHLVCSDENLQYIMQLYKQCKDDERPRILALTYPLFTSTKKDLDEEMKNESTDSSDSTITQEAEETEENETEEKEIEQKDKRSTPVENDEADIENAVERSSSKELKKKDLVESIGEYENLDDFDMYEKLEWKIDELERELCCQMDLAEDVDGGKRLSASITKPKELIVEYSPTAPVEKLPDAYIELDKYMRDTVNDALGFLDEHRYDPTEIYGEDLYEEFMTIPNPTIEPRYIFMQFLYVLDQLGPYAADKAAFSLLTKVEKLKIKVPYERHFLLLCLCTSIFVKIRCYADLIFSKYETDWERITTFSAPKILRLSEILEKYQPKDGQKELNRSVKLEKKDSLDPKNEVTSKMLNDLEKCDFITLGNKIEDKVNTYEANLKEISDMEIDRGQNVKQEYRRRNDDKSDGLHKVVGFVRRSGHRVRGRGRILRNNAARAQLMQQNPDALCGIVFVKEALMAKILFMLIVDMSRCRPGLAYICAQYCAVEQPADPGTEPKECQRQSKKQEEVLKKFRMHECNLLLTTSALEEGIDLPRCNLVLRWDFPASSYGLCRGRARAARAACVLLSRGRGSGSGSVGSGHTDALLHNVATYRELDQIISRKCGCGVQDEPPQSEEDHADSYTNLVKSYSPSDSGKEPSKNKEDKSKDQMKNHDNTKINEKLDQEIKENHIDKENNTDREIIEKVDNYNDKVSDKSDIGKCKVKKSSDTDNNLVCNKCNKKRVDNNVECACVSVDHGIVSDKSKVDRRNEDSVASVDLSTAIALINRYCGKLPSDTFTRLAPQWWMEKVQLPVRGSTEKRVAYICTLRLPLNCPVKYNIVGHPMPTRVLARRMVALQACRILHKSGELDNQLMPIGKENFKAAELEGASGNIGNYGNAGGDFNDPNDTARPGTTKRRQYYFKRTAWAFTDCQPVVDTSDSEIDPPEGTDKPKKSEPKEVTKGTKRNMLYAVVSKLWCALPERYNTRGRRLHAPQNASQAIGILMAREEPDELQIPAFPVYTRSGEVRVSVERAPDADVRLSPRRSRLVRRFMRFVFGEVLRVRRKGMKLQSEGSTHNNYYIVPTVKITNEDGSTKIDIDWHFLELIYQHTEQKKNSELEKPIVWQQDEEDDAEEESVSEDRVDKEECKKDGKEKVKKMDNPLLKAGEIFHFDSDKYREAVVTPWYRNQDQPQFFLVAEICWNLSPDSEFPSDTHTSFRNYYSSKYGVVLTQSDQPLLDVDHTSARLNLLTPRYVNRKGVALPVSSERTRRAKRDRLDQKQILVPELCRVHPFAAPLWFATVALPCVLYRINALLIADEIRRAVAIDVGLGIPKIDEKTCPGFQWPPLDFGWSLAEVLSADAEKNEKKKEELDEERDKMEELRDLEDEQQEEENIEEKQEIREKTINDILQEKEDAESGFEIGTWSNDMASSIPQTTEYDEFMEPLPSNLTLCTSASGGANWCDPIEKPKSHFNPTRTFSVADSDCSYLSSDFDTDDSDLNSDGSDEDTDTGFCSSKNTNAAMGVRIEYKTAHEAEAVDVERKKKSIPAPQPDDSDDIRDRRRHDTFIRTGNAPVEYIEKFRQSVAEHKKEILDKGFLVKEDEPLVDILPEPTKDLTEKPTSNHQDITKLEDMFPYGEDTDIMKEAITLEAIERNKRKLLNGLRNSLNPDEVKKLNCFSMIDVDIDSPGFVNEKVVNVGFDTKEAYVGKTSHWRPGEFKPYYQEGRTKVDGKEFDFDFQPELDGHPGPSPSVILQALTMSNANDGINLERLETIGDSFLKFAITAYLYCAHPTVHEGKLSHMRSKQVSNLNLYRLGRGRRLGARMTASKFEPHDNWLPPCYRPPPTLHARAADSQDQTAHSMETALDSSGCFIPYNLITQHSIPDKSIADCVEALIGAYLLECGPRGALLFMSWLGIRVLPRHLVPLPPHHPYVAAAAAAAHHSDQKLPPQPSPKREPRDYSDSDTDCSSDDDDDDEQWLEHQELYPEADWSWAGRPVGSLRPYRDESGQWVQPIFGELKAPPSPLLRYIQDPEGELEQMLSGYEALERRLQYRFADRSLLLQALTHASHHRNRLTDCYQRLEFLGDAILDYLITRHLYEDPRRHSPGALTDLRSALVNNTIFATLAARHGFHKYFRHMSPGLNEVLTKYVKIQEENGHSISEEHYLIQEDEMEQAEDVEVPKALGDLFESVAGAIFLDSGMSLDAVWKSYVNLMGAELEAFSAAAPKSPVRELLEAEPDTAKFGKPERLADGRRVRVCVEVFGRGAFKGVGRNYRIAKGTAARCALRHLRKHRAY